jgi:hypothetical protein
MRQSQTAVIERNVTWSGDFETEPYETSWSGEALFFVRALEAEELPSGSTARIQISPDGIHWCDEGSNLILPQANNVAFCRVSHFGGWLRLVGQLPDGASMKVIVYLSLKE